MIWEELEDNVKLILRRIERLERTILWLAGLACIMGLIALLAWV